MIYYQSMKGLLLMTSKEMASVFLQTNSDNYDKFSAPLYFHEEGPYLAALKKEGKSCTIFFNEFLDSDTFLAKPQRLAPAFSDRDFLGQLLESFAEDLPDHPDVRSLTFVPPTIACKMQVKKMYRTCAPLASRIFFMDAAGKLSYSGFL